MSQSSSARPSSYLHRACENCRHRKIRCDGERPVCRRCRLQPPRSLTPCKYSHGTTGGVSPPLDIGSEQEPADIVLSDPYLAHSLGAVATLKHNEQLDGWNNAMYKSTPSPIEELPELTGTMMDIFLRHFTRHQFFFLDSVRFQQSTLLPTVNPDHPPVGLLHTICLWANHISPTSVALSMYSEEDLLARAVRSHATDVATIGDAPRLLHLIQAEVLLSFYYLDCGCSMEGNYHRAAATSLALTARLHQLGTPSQSRYSTLDFFNVNLAAPGDAIRARELVNAFWSVVVLNNYWVAASGTPSNIPSDAPINTPWPTDHSVAPLVPNMSFSVPVDSRDNDVQGHSAFTLLAKASILLERTVAFTIQYPEAHLASQALPLPLEFWTIEHRLDSFRGHLLLDTSETSQMSLITHVFANTAILRLGGPNCAICAVARSKCLTAANCVSTRLNEARLDEWNQADPILGPLLGIVADALMGILPHVPQAAPDLQTTLAALHTLSRWSPLIRQCLAATQQQYATLGFLG
ncbi:hypothetical protein C8F04DRAFT_1228648 [Mycena alexandri]|uniref:Zn(2)-C6 fungal-type domain-containing protein n=1 Tax=Mycena alexandri TaxID=1745969 RepID=A0AAD6TFL9_9AGAR|nr:hypothetical protein C8F04DRAFT_1228648 [Mycena alexandri]